ncbi:nucleic acid-binding protein [Gloeophyllum trabeum ATCC 11539]|uniref:Nucleic acid-binding protein n=1 Tax=Gloeophyllum trabeum (strain ATCC 11539 / FP-39264 / Madison 617) TaxID=670483 RepID=S7QK86_GLOTA|nr:nucleic acid-binding protein [Gloeophyllum trabeum ATCC 11539]EPQ59653.1 nucleic acid-binding protein [Gloeophyllum trabeum ATCC 11539]
MNMFNAARHACVLRSSTRAFSTSRVASADLSKLILIGRLGKDPEVRRTKSDQEYVAYTVATTNYPPPPPNPDGTRREAGTTWHTIFSFHPSSNSYLKNLTKGSRVYVEANFELRQPDPTADPDSPQGQRQIFLRHESVRVLSPPPQKSDSGEQ